MQVSGRITEIVLRTDDKETGVKISFSLDSEQELDLARMRGQQLTFHIEPKQILRQASLFERPEPQVIFAGKADHPWEPEWSEVDGVEHVKCASGCGLPEEVHLPWRDHLYQPLPPEELEAWQEVPDKCGANNCGFPASFHYRRPDHLYEEWTGLGGPKGDQLMTRCVHCQVPKGLHPRDMGEDGAEFDPETEGEPPDGDEPYSENEPSTVEPASALDEDDPAVFNEADGSQLAEAQDREEREAEAMAPSQPPEVGAALPGDLVASEPEPEVGPVPSYPYSETDRATEENLQGTRRGRGRGGRGRSTGESAEPATPEGVAEPGDTEA